MSHRALLASLCIFSLVANAYADVAAAADDAGATPPAPGVYLHFTFGAAPGRSASFREMQLASDEGLRLPPSALAASSLSPDPAAPAEPAATSSTTTWIVLGVLAVGAVVLIASNQHGGGGGSGTGSGY